MLLSLLIVTAAQAQTVDDYASRPGWACSYNQERTMCAGDDTFGEIAANHVVSFCDDDVCTESWRAAIGGADRDRAAVAWAAVIQEEYRQERWIVGPAPAPKNWLAVMRTPDRAVSLELGAEFVLLTVEPLPFCDPNTQMKALNPYLLAVSSTIDKDWPAATESEIPSGIDAAVVEKAAARIGQDPPADIAQRMLLASEPFACFRQGYRAKETMEAVRLAVQQWEVWRNPSPKERRLREKEERKLAKESGEERDVGAEDVEDVPDE